MIALLKELRKAFDHFFFPHHCAGCGSDHIHQDALLCSQCFYRLPITDYFNRSDNPVEKTFWGRIPIAAAGSWLYFSKGSGIKQLLHALKYHHRPDIGIQLGRAMGVALKAADRFDHVDALIPLPLFPERERIRGYNQAERIAVGMSEVLHIPVFNDVVKRVRATKTQTKQDRRGRWQNIYNSFAVSQPQAIFQKRLLLIDDIITTGATLEACGQALLEHRPRSLSIATVAYTAK